MKNYQDKTREELLSELERVQVKYSALEEFCKTGVSVNEKEKTIFEQLIRIMDEFIRFCDENPDFNKILQTIIDISGASYGVLNICDENGLDFTTVAAAGIGTISTQLMGILGFDVVNKHWKYDPNRAAVTAGRVITRFAHINELSGNIIPGNVILLLEKIFGIGEVFLVKVMKEDKVLGDFTLVFKKDTTIANTRFVELCARLVGLFLDRNASTKALRNSEKRHSSMIANISDVIAVVGTDDVLKFISPNVEKWFGWHPDELVGYKGWLTVHPDDIEFINTEFVALLRHDNLSKKMECRVMCKNGEYKRIGLTAVNLTNDETIGGFLINFHDITESKQAEEDLINSQAELKTIYQSAPVMMCVVDRNRKVLYANDAFTSFTGIPEALLKEGSACGVFGCINALENEKGCGFGKKCSVCNLLQAMEDTLKNGTGHNNIEYSATLKQNGKQRDVSLIGSTASIKTSFQNRLLLCLYDITERKKMEETLRNLSQAVEQSPVSIVITDTDGNIEYGNPNVSKLTGYKLEDLAGKNPRIFKSGHTSDEEYAQLWKTITSGGEWKSEFLNKKKDGELYWENVMISPIKNHQGEISHFLAVKSDISDRKQKEELLRQSEERYKNLSSQLEAILDHIPGLVFYKDKQNNFIRVNKYVANAYLKSKEELQGVNLKNLHSPQVAEQYYQDDMEVINSGEARLNIEEPWETAEGIKWVNTSKIPFVNGSGEILGVIGISMDITERKMVAKELDKKNEELLKANIEKDKFFSIIAHDLRAPLSGFMKLTEMMDDELSNMPQQQIHLMVKNMKASAENVFRLLGNLLEWSRMQRGLGTFNPEPLVLRLIVADSIMLLQQAADQKEILITTTIPDEMIVFADINMLQGILRNLISNAIKFTPKRGAIHVSAKKATENTVEIAIKDSGIGMNADILADIFRLDNSVGRKGTEGEPSTGLGLIICKDFIEKNGGILQVESEAGIGSTFLFTLPASTNYSAETATITATPLPKEIIQNKKLKILIVEDDETSQMLISISLKSLADEILTVVTGSEAIEMCRLHPDLDLILMDIKMPGIDGYEATRQIRQFNPKVIIIAQTAFESGKEREKAHQAGCNDYISKPLKIALLKELIATHLVNPSQP